MVQLLWVHGGLAIFAGIIIILFPKVFFFLIGSFLVANAGILLLQGTDLLVSIAVAIAGVLVFISPRLVAWFIAFYLALFSLLLFFWGFWFLAIPGFLVALFVALTPKIAPFLIGSFLIAVGGLGLVANFL